MTNKNAESKSIETNKQQIKTPLGTMMDMAKNEIGTHVLNCMQANDIPPSIMAYILRVILLDISEMKVEQVSEELVMLQKLTQSQNNIFEKQEG